MGNFTNVDTSLLRWRANYSDGTVLWEIHPQTHKENRFSDIDLNKLASFDLLLPIKDMEDVKLSETDVQVGTLDDKPAIVTLKVYNRESMPFYHLELPPGGQLIFARRHQLQRGRKIAVFKIKGGEVKIPFPIPAGKKIYIIGWKQKVGKHIFQAQNFIYPNGQIQLDYTWRQDADHGRVDMPGDVPMPQSTTSTDAIIKENKSSSTTKLGDDSQPREGLPDEIMN